MRGVLVITPQKDEVPFSEEDATSLASMVSFFRDEEDVDGALDVALTRYAHLRKKTSKQNKKKENKSSSDGGKAVPSV